MHQRKGKTTPYPAPAPFDISEQTTAGKPSFIMSHDDFSRCHQQEQALISSTLSSSNNNKDENDANNNDKHDSNNPMISVTMSHAGFYILSGCSQPMLMTICRNSGLADPSCQLYMFFYYLGPSSVLFWLLCGGNNINDNESSSLPKLKTVLKAVGIAMFDITAQSMNYTGASLAGPTIFAIVYSSVTVWTALFSRMFLRRSMNTWQWIAVVIVFGGLALTATDTLQLGQDVIRGLFLVICGSMMHALTYVMSEAIMTVGEDKLSIYQNCAVQGGVASTFFFLWQCFYIFPRRQEKIFQPMQTAGTTPSLALGIFSLFALANLIHAITFFHTLRHFPGGATSAGVMKGLQAVLVFVLTHVAYCGRTGGDEMCFTKAKFLSLVTVVSGVIGYGVATQQKSKHGPRETSRRLRLRHGYERISDAKGSSVEIKPLTHHVGS